MEWIEKFDFGNLPVEDRRTNEEHRRTVENLCEITHENITETLRKRLGLDFLHRNNFFSLISSDLENPEGLNIFLLHSSPYL